MSYAPTRRHRPDPPEPPIRRPPPPPPKEPVPATPNEPRPSIPIRREPPEPWKPTKPAATKSASKALLLKLALRAAAQREISARAQATLAILIAESWPWDTYNDAWWLRTSRRQLARRLACSIESIKRAIAELERADMVVKQQGKGQRVSRFVIAISMFRQPEERGHPRPR